MATYFIGDIQGCFQEFTALLSKVSFNQEIDELWVTGDMVARGPDSLSTLRFIKNLGDSAKVVLGNHDLHLLAIHAGIKKAKKNDLLADLLAADDVDELMDWLAIQPLVRKLPNQEVYMSHAGLSPQWDSSEALIQGQFAQKLISSPNRNKWLKSMYGEEPSNWHNVTNKIERFRYTVNAFTRMRYCQLDLSLEFNCKHSPQEAPENIKPWFELSKVNSETVWIFGHWAALMGQCSQPNVYALDTGCVWGNYLTLFRWEDKKIFTEPAHNDN